MLAHIAPTTAHAQNRLGFDSLNVSLRINYPSNVRGVFLVARYSVLCVAGLRYSQSGLERRNQCVGSGQRHPGLAFGLAIIPNVEAMFCQAMGMVWSSTEHQPSTLDDWVIGFASEGMADLSLGFRSQTRLGWSGGVSRWPAPQRRGQ